MTTSRLAWDWRADWRREMRPSNVLSAVARSCLILWTVAASPYDVPSANNAAWNCTDTLVKPGPPIATYTQDTVLRIPAEKDAEADRRLLRETGFKVVRGDAPASTRDGRPTCC